MISIILPFYKRFHEFSIALAHNAQYFGGYHQVVIVLDEPTQTHLVVDLIKAYPNIKWLVIENPNDHNWRNPAVAINVGIRNAEGSYVIIMSPESLCYSNVPFFLMETAVMGRYYCNGHVSFCTYKDLGELGVDHIENKFHKYFYGSICVKREALVQIQGYDESNIGWGADDDNIRTRLNLHGYQQRYIGHARVIHPSDEPRTPYGDKMFRSKPAHILKPTTAIANNEHWGTEFSNVVYRT